jgi:thioredoxin
MNFLRKLFPVLAGATLLVLAGCGNPAVMNESTANVKHITQGEFADEVTRCATPVVADFYATWCEPCRMLSPMLDKLAGGYADKIKFVKINVDESPGLAQNFQVQAIPTLIFFKDGKVADRFTGLPDEADLKARLDKFSAGK